MEKQDYAGSAENYARSIELKEELNDQKGLRELYSSYLNVLIMSGKMDEAEKPLDEYKTFEEIFTRALKPGMRPIQGKVVTPCDSILRYSHMVDFLATSPATRSSSSSRRWSSPSSRRLVTEIACDLLLYPRSVVPPKLMFACACVDPC